MLNRLCLVTAIFLIAACSSSAPAPSMNHYVLDTVRDHSGSDVEVQLAQVRVLSIPDYLNQNALVMMIDDHKLELARYHTWADRLSDSIAKVVEYEYNAQLAKSANISACESCHQIGLSIEHFYPTSTGDVFLTGYYQYQNENKELIKRRFNLSGAMQADGYQAAVAEMRRLLKELSEQIAAEAS